MGDVAALVAVDVDDAVAGGVEPGVDTSDTHGRTLRRQGGQRRGAPVASRVLGEELLVEVGVGVDALDVLELLEAVEEAEGLGGSAPSQARP